VDVIEVKVDSYYDTLDTNLERMLSEIQIVFILHTGRFINL